ncbi:MAG: hypothetical protein HYS05_15605 [Acidobacteria bacterium]|nr:hypothetical protein [Acidobacteriota bacterium]
MTYASSFTQTNAQAFATGTRATSQVFPAPPRALDLPAAPGTRGPTPAQGSTSLDIL